MQVYVVLCVKMWKLAHLVEARLDGLLAWSGLMLPPGVFWLTKQFGEEQPCGSPYFLNWIPRFGPQHHK